MLAIKFTSIFWHSGTFLISVSRLRIADFSDSLPERNGDYANLFFGTGVGLTHWAGQRFCEIHGSCCSTLYRSVNADCSLI